ncbi:hypothetical protein ACFOU2_17695 [Bacillus songklensis]|uniref:Glycogen biosynthesis protein GlgD n=1 Tax=Bacillus songklensis TaxID=1069116 RepID=A0ABV8B6N7_9BACI
MAHKHSNQVQQKAIIKSGRTQPEFSNEFVANQAPKSEHYKKSNKE